MTEALPVGDFTELHTRGMFDVTFVQNGPGEKVRAEVTTSSNIVPFITAETKDGVLTLVKPDFFSAAFLVEFE